MLEDDVSFWSLSFSCVMWGDSAPMSHVTGLLIRMHLEQRSARGSHPVIVTGQYGSFIGTKGSWFSSRWKVTAWDVVSFTSPGLGQRCFMFLGGLRPVLRLGWTGFEAMLSWRCADTGASGLWCTHSGFLLVPVAETLGPDP